MFFKPFNNSAKHNSLILILLVFGIYFHIIDINVPSLIINQQNIAMCKTMEEIRKSHASCQVNNALNT